MEQPVVKSECLACGYSDYRMATNPVGDLIPNSCPQCHGDMTIKSKDELPKKLENVVNSVNERFYIWDFVISPEEMEFSVESEKRKEKFSELLEDLKKQDYLARMEEEDGELSISVRESPEIEESNIMINIGLFLATIVTTFGVAGYWYLYDGNILNAALFSSALLTILSAHELGHKISTWRHDIEATWPYFLPIPHPLIGTLGAVIKNKSPIPSKEALAELGASGPLFGVVFAIPITIIGLTFSPPSGGETFLWGTPPLEALPTPLIYGIFESLIFGHFTTSMYPHPLAWAGFIGLFVTWLNLLPTGQLDGGHVARSLMSQDKHFMLTRFIGFLFLFLSLLWTGFLIIALLILFLVGSPHPGSLDNVSELKKKQKVLAGITIIVFILCLPIPMWMV